MMSSLFIKYGVMAQVKKVEEEALENYVIFANENGATIAVTPKFIQEDVEIQYSTDDGGTWVAATHDSEIDNTSNNTIWFRGKAPTLKRLFTASATGNAWGLADTTHVYGNLNFLLCDDFGDEVAPTTLAAYCYSYMFYGCTSLTEAPELPATTLENYCYYDMFRDCTLLTKAPELPATTLADYCYRYMFASCTNLNEGAPDLPATTLADRCYANMFWNCTSLEEAPELPATTLPGYCYSYMFRGCTSLTKAPELPATTLENYCYSRMFQDCTDLAEVTLHYTGTASVYTSYWLTNVASTGTMYKAGTQYTTTGNSTIPATWTQVQI